VPDEEGVHFLEVAQTGFVFLRMLQDFKAEGYQFFSDDFDWPGFFVFVLFLVRLKVEESLCLSLDTLRDLFLDIADVLVLLGLRFEEEFYDLVFLIAENLIGCVGGSFDLDVFQFCVGDVEG